MIIWETEKSGISITEMWSLKRKQPKVEIISFDWTNWWFSIIILNIDICIKFGVGHL